MRMTVLRDVLLEPRTVTCLVGVIVLLALLEQTILTLVVMPSDLRRVVLGAWRVLRVGRLFLVGRVVQLLVARVVLVAFAHC